MKNRINILIVFMCALLITCSVSAIEFEGVDNIISVDTSTPAEVTIPVEEETPPETVAAEAPTEPVQKVTVKSGDSLWKLAEQYLGDGSRYWEIVEANKDKYPSLIKNPNLILVGWELTINIPEAVKPPADPEQPPADDPTDPEPQPQLTLEQKMEKLQGIVNEMNRYLLKQNPPRMLTELNAGTIRRMIELGFMTEEEWLAMNPPTGYRWAIANGKIILLPQEITPVTDPDPDDGTLPPGDDDDGDTEDDETGDDGKKFDADNYYDEQLNELGIPDILAKGDSAYYSAINSASKFDYGFDMFRNFPLNIFSLQKDLKVACEQLQKAFEKNKHTKVMDKPGLKWPLIIANPLAYLIGVGIENAISPDITTAAKKVEQSAEKLKKAWSEFQFVVSRAKKSEEACQKTITDFKAKYQAAQAELNTIQQTPQNASRISELLKDMENSQNVITRHEKRLTYLQPIKNLFNL